MKFESINKRYTEKVAEYLAQGWYINSASMAGHQGEISKIDLTNGTDIIRIMLDSGTVRTTENGHYYYLERVALVVGLSQPENRVRPNSSSNFDTIWNERLDILYCEEFYEIGRGRYEKWYGTREEAKAQQDMQRERMYRSAVNSREDVTENPKIAAVILRAVRREKGMKTVTAKEIERITRRHTESGLRYEVRVRGKDVTIRSGGATWASR